MTDTLVRMLGDEEGATLVEYGLVVSLIAVASIAAMTTLGTNISNMFNNIANVLANP